jgi:hypothetical protein
VPADDAASALFDAEEDRSEPGEVEPATEAVVERPAPHPHPASEPPGELEADELEADELEADDPDPTAVLPPVPPPSDPPAGSP